MIVLFASDEIARLCTDQAAARRLHGDHYAKGLGLRIAQLRSITRLDQVLEMTGRWEKLRYGDGDEFSGRITQKWRIVVRTAESPAAGVVVVDVEGYHK